MRRRAGDRHGKPPLPTTGHVTNGGRDEAYRQLEESFVGWRGLGRQPGIEHDRHVAALAAFKLADNRPAELGGRTPVDPPQAIPPLPGTQAVIVPFADAALRLP